ncbi:MAG: HDIG domain-containing protein [Clostridia bacterium]|nr:HDIG domain-containing protein [Clostridia bacterium]
MKITSKQKLITTIVLFLTTVLTIAMVFYAYLPVKYNLKPGSVCDTDIYAPRKFEDEFETEKKAILAKTSVEAIFVRSDSIVADNVDKVNTFFTLLDQARKMLGENEFDYVLDYLMKAVADDGINISQDDAIEYLNMTSSAFSFIEDKAVTLTDIIMLDNVSLDNLGDAVNSAIDNANLSSSSYFVYNNLLKRTLNSILTPNSVFDSLATAQAQDNAYNKAMSEPVYVDKGALIVASGDIVTQQIYNNLKEVELIREDDFDWIFLIRITVYCLIIILSFVLFFRNATSLKKTDIKLTIIIAVTYLIPVAVAIYLSRFSSLATIVLYFTIIATTYLGTRNGVILSLVSLLIMWPMYGFEAEYIFVYFVGIIVCSVLAGAKSDRNYSASLVIFPVICVAAASLAYSFINNSTRNDLINNLIWSSLVTLISVVFAVGFMPIYEMLTDGVSPIKLITLSQTGNPLLKRMFVECPGTSQHSIMVSNLAESAAEAIGADALFCKVASYYHDIGKLRDPAFFTENQNGYNPHDGIEVEQSVQIITDHVDYGVTLAEKNKLPDAIIKVIREHHGDTYPKFFYVKACKKAQEEGRPEPSVDDFRYHGSVPSSKESAIIMLADTCEAAVKSAKINNKDDAEKFIRKLVKEKISEDQMKESELSFSDIEKIINSFVQVYSGMFHERILYPE